MFDLINGPYSLYDSDKPLLKSLGLKTDVPLPVWEEVELGTVTIYPFGEDHPVYSTVKVSVAAVPAQFYTFVVETGDEEDPSKRTRTTLKTGSGNFSEYWQTAKQIADHMLVITTEVV